LVCKIKNNCQLLCLDAKDFDFSSISTNEKTLLILDPPYDKWDKFKFLSCDDADSIIAFCSPQSRHNTESVLGKPKTEIVWFFKDGRWVSNNLPRITHNYIYVYGKTHNAFVGELQNQKSMSKGSGAIGKDGGDVLGKRIYRPNKQKQLNSVLEFPKNMKNFGAWGKPQEMFTQIINWIDPDVVIDLFMGSGSVGIAALNAGKKYIGIESDEQVFLQAKKAIVRSQQQQDFFSKDADKNKTMCVTEAMF